MSQAIELSTTVLCPSVSPEPSEAQFRLDDTAVSVKGRELAEEAELKEIFDIRLGEPPQAAGSALSGTILTIGFERSGQRAVLFVDGTESTLDRVSGLLFRRLLDGTEVAVCYPATVGGRVTNRQTERGKLRIAPGKVGCTSIRQPLHIELDSVVGVNRSSKELLGPQEPTVEFQFVKQGVVVGVDLSLRPPRKLNLLGRYLRRIYSRTMQQLRELDPPAPVIRVLTRLYAQRGSTDSGTLLKQESKDPEAILQNLLENGLVEVTDGEVSLTMLGWVLVADRVGETDVLFD